MSLNIGLFVCRLNRLYQILGQLCVWARAGAGRPAAAQGVHLLSRIYSQFYFMQNRPKIVENISRGWAPDRLTLPISGRAPPSV